MIVSTFIGTGKSHLTEHGLSVIMIESGSSWDQKRKGKESLEQLFPTLIYFAYLPAGISILIRNYIETSVMKQNPGLITNKLDSEKHGYGIKSVKAIVARKNGLIDIYEEDQMFCTHIFLPMQHSEYLL